MIGSTACHNITILDDDDLEGPHNFSIRISGTNSSGSQIMTDAASAIVFRIRDVSRAADHVMKFPRPSPSTQVIKNWRCKRPGNEASIVLVPLGNLCSNMKCALSLHCRLHNCS